MLSRIVIDTLIERLVGSRERFHDAYMFKPYGLNIVHSPA
jgi:hypothetical protein